MIRKIDLGVSMRWHARQDPGEGAPAAMDEVSHDPGAMIAELARAMMPERRGRFLDAACGGDAKLRAEVEARLAYTVGGNESEPAAESVAHEEKIQDAVPGSLESIALDALNAAPDTTEVMESQAEAPSDLPIDVYCDQDQLDPVARLRLVQQVCRVIDQDHHHGLIHGGLTPRHVRVSPDGSIHVIPREQGEGAVEDQAASLHASPEQVLGEPATTASDVYGLGVLLYELLTGRYPYRVSLGDPDEIGNAISEQAPSVPASRSSGQTRRLDRPRRSPRRGGRRPPGLHGSSPVISS